MEVAGEVDDDVFFADLSKQISQLIMDDEEDPVAHFPRVTLQVLHHLLFYSFLYIRIDLLLVGLATKAFSQALHPIRQPPFLYDQISRREGKGTGVFIPRSSNPRRKNRQGRSTSSNNINVQRHIDNSRGLPNNTSTRSEADQGGTDQCSGDQGNQSISVQYQAAHQRQRSVLRRLTSDTALPFVSPATTRQHSGDTQALILQNTIYTS
ncbi:unnamed protein product [Ilex paraguariensis]|uniref:Uncharacterized protein n=1 Tax=Ilex paraguariensis TaxID=185542 RepID=A0ABC8TVY9_9AQUA